jgi:hypothetical protein
MTNSTHITTDKDGVMKVTLESKHQSELKKGKGVAFNSLQELNDSVNHLNQSSVAISIYNQLTKDKEGSASFTIADIRAASNKVFTGNKDGKL